MVAPIDVIHYESFSATPWRNGGGVTREAIRVPACGDPFLWRVSVAEIEMPGPFSDFSGYQRKMTLLRGNGIALFFSDGAKHELQKPGDMVVFDGGMPTRCELLNGACVDLNLIVRDGIKVDARVALLSGAQTLGLAAGTTVLIFPIDGLIEVTGFDGAAVAVAPWDLAMAYGDHGPIASMSVAPKSSAPCLVFLATMYA